MAQDFNQAKVYTLAEIQQYYEADGKLSALINTLKRSDPIMEHALWKEGNLTDGHKGKLVTKLPEADFRRLYRGTPYSKSGIAMVREPTRQVSSRWGIDVDALKLYEGSDAQNAFRMQEGKNHIESMRQKVTTQLFYGNPDVDADEVRGLASHYKYKDSPNVIDAGGTGSDNTSIWGVVWGDMEFFGVYPKNMRAGLQHEDLGKFDAEDAGGLKYRAVGDEWKWDFGFFLADWRMVVRICNIDVSNLDITDIDDANYVDLHKLTVKAKNRVPSSHRSRIKWYAGETAFDALEYMADNPKITYLRKGEYLDSKEITMLHGKPIFQCDSISETESALIVTP